MLISNPANIRVGTIGFGYKQWVGPFYPTGTRPAHYLPAYSRTFNTVELDTTFHATPTPQRIQQWAELVPENFRFCVKTPQAITHQSQPDDGKSEMLTFLDAIRVLKQKLGIVLLQYPPTFTAQHIPRLKRLLSSLPTDIRFAVEFRHNSWHTDQAAEILREYRCALVAGDYLTSTQRFVPSTTDFYYIRCVGEHQRFTSFTHEQIDVTDRLENWRKYLIGLASVSAAWIFFGDEYSGHAPAAAQRFQRLIGQDPSPPAGQAQLF